MRILFFGKLGETIGREVQLALPDDVTTVGQLRRLLAERHPQADLTSPRLRVCVDDSVAGDEEVVRDENEVAFLPPLSGG